MVYFQRVTTWHALQIKNLSESNAVAYPALVSRGVSERRKCKWLVRVGASNGVTPHRFKKNHGRGGGVSGQPENPPGYTTEM